MKLLALTCLLVGYLLSAVENVALDRNFDQSRARSVEEKFNRGAVESRPAVQRPGSFNRAAVESFPSLGLSQRIPLRDAVEGRPPLDSIPAEYDIRDSPLVDSNLIPISAGPNPFLFGPPLPVNFIVKNIPEETVDEPCSNVDTLRGTFDCSRYQMCIHGQWKDQKCPPTLHWNAKTSSCDWPAAAGCTKNIDEWTTETPVTSPARPTEGNDFTEATPVEWPSVESSVADTTPCDDAPSETRLEDTTPSADAVESREQPIVAPVDDLSEPM